MLTIKKLLLIMTTILLPIFALAQDAVYDGQVIDKKSELGIPNVSVILLKEKTGTQTNDQGYFRLVSTQKLLQDTLVFTSVGYKPFKLAVADHQPQIFITLEPSNTQLSQVNITDKKLKVFKLERFSWSDIHDEPVNTIFQTEYAKFFKTERENMILGSVQVGRRSTSNTETDNMYTSFLIHILAVDPKTGAPGDVLFTKQVSVPDNSLFITADLSSDKLTIPVTRFFLSIEWQRIPYNQVIILQSASKAYKLKKNGEQLLMDASQYKVNYQPFLVGVPQSTSRRYEPRIKIGSKFTKAEDPMHFLRPDRPDTFMKINDRWVIVDTNYDVALSANIHY